MAQPFKIAEPKKKGKKKGGHKKRSDVNRMVAAEKLNKVSPRIATYISIAAPKSRLPKKHYCDITGYPAPYKDKATGLWFANSRAYTALRNLSHAQSDALLSFRNGTLAK
ncbi:INO80 complex subunit C, INO80C [Carpediemonas membranifera]|uniref:INO80 complex subunit C, INO80C n=1 Tax=Carpediemonas membranifera TaxID=201153 RepID=A0A8J6B1G6_9EUKA|nr:INO80 complex subunit C, INO80C [Carpediemonas membranifera]|eukprot:KAG9393648.1 INO80 complex subunit C, INO80C [Carpediemonas membranifera]